MSIKCWTCGATTEVKGSFHKERHFFRHSMVFYCPLCLAKRQQFYNKVSPLIGLALTLACIVVAAFAPENSVQSMVAWFGLNLSLGYFFMFLQILPHELGHALMASLLGWRVFRITIGKGGNLCRLRCGRVFLEINAPPLGGQTWMASKSSSYYRTKRFLISLAGPLTNAMLLLAVLFLMPESYTLAPLPIMPEWYTVAPLPNTNLFVGLVLKGSCIVLLVMNLLPFRVTAVLGSTATQLDSDGLVLLTTFFLSSSAIRKGQAGHFLLEGIDSCLQGDYQRAKQWHEQGLELYPEDFWNRYLLAAILIVLKEFHASRDQWLLLLMKEDLSPTLRPNIVNDLAWTNLMIGDKELLAEADRLSQEAIRDQSWFPSIQGTRGSILIELGEIDKGMPLVRQAFDANDNPRSKALNACYLALGEHRRGNRLEAQRQRELARKLDAQCVLLDKVNQALAADQPSV